MIVTIHFSLLSYHVIHYEYKHLIEKQIFVLTAKEILLEQLTIGHESKRKFKYPLHFLVPDSYVKRMVQHAAHLHKLHKENMCKDIEAMTYQGIEIKQAVRNWLSERNINIDYEDTALKIFQRFRKKKISLQKKQQKVSIFCKKMSLEKDTFCKSADKFETFEQAAKCFITDKRKKFITLRGTEKKRDVLQVRQYFCNVVFGISIPETAEYFQTTARSVRRNIYKFQMKYANIISPI